MKKTKKTSTTAFKMRHRTLALLLLILIAFSSASCNTVPLPDGTEAHTNAQSEKATQKRTEAQSEKETQKQTDNIEQLAQIVPFNWEIEERISQEYWEKYYEIEKSYPQGPPEYSEWMGPEIEFYGQFEDAYILYVEDAHNHYLTGAYFIEGYEFRFQGGTKLYAYRDGEFLSLEEALENEIIDIEDLEIIHQEFKRLHSDLYKQYYAYNIRYGEPQKGVVNIILQPSYNEKEYTVEDFADVGCTELIYTVSEEKEPHIIYRSFDVYFDADTLEELLLAIRKLELREDIYLAQLRLGFVLDSIPNDEEYVMSSDNAYWAINKISLPDAWDEVTESSTVLVGIIDSGIDGTHPDLQNMINSDLSKCFVDGCSCTNGLTDADGHGTQAAGIVGAQANNSIGVAGVCWNVQLVSLKVKDTDHPRHADIAEAIAYAKRNNIKILSMSVGAHEHVSDLESQISSYNGLIICSAGNGAANIDDSGIYIYKYYPSSYNYDHIISVGASTPDDTRLSTSNYGAISVDIFAPGVNILTTYPIAKCQNGTCGYDHTAEGAFAEGYHYFDNTSAATPFVAGVAALLLSQEPDDTPQNIKERITKYSDKIAAFTNLCTSGGRLDAYQSLHTPHACNDSYSQHSSSQHKAYCECGYYELTSHSYTKRYSPVGWSSHKAYCVCGAYITEAHDLRDPNSAGVATCRKCGYGVQMWGDKPKPELELM